MIAAVSTRKALAKLEPGLPASWYHDPAHYQRELEAFWYGRWIAVAREEELPRPGDWRVIRLGSQQVLLLKDQEGKTQAFHNVCRHRGSVLCTGESGTFPRARITCPYHAWTYDLDGRLIRAPHMGEYEDFDPSGIRLVRPITQCRSDVYVATVAS